MSSAKCLLTRLVTAVCLVALPHVACADDKSPKAKKAATPEQAVEFLAAASKAGDVDAALDQIAQPFRDIMLWYILDEDADQILGAALDQQFGKKRREGFGMGVKLDLLRIQKIEILATERANDAKVKFRVRETGKSLHDDGIETMETTYLVVKDGENWKVLRPFTALVFRAKDKDIAEQFVSKKGPDGKEVGVHQITIKKDLDALGANLRTVLEKENGRKLHEMLDRMSRAKAAAEKVAVAVKSGAYKTREQANDAYAEAVRLADQEKQK